MNKLVILLIVLMVIEVGFLSGCNESTFKSDKEKFVGTWVFSLTDATITYTFLSDDTLTIVGTYEGVIEDTTNGTWKILDNKLVLTTEENTGSVDYSFSDDGKTLTLTLSGQDAVFTKQE